MPSRSQDEFLNLPFQEKLEFLYGLPARQKRDLILSAPEAERLVQSFSPETLFYTLKEIGSADASDLLSLALPEQVKSLFDLDCWNKDRPNFHRMREWIESLAEAGRIRMADSLMELDMEIVALLLRRYIKVHRLDDPSLSEDPPSNRYVQFDEHYLIEFILNDDITSAISDFLEEAFEREYKYFAGLLEEVYWGVQAELEEQAYQFRRARLSDRGFPDYFEAQDVFAYINPSEFIALRDRHEKPSRADLLDDTEVVPPDAAPAISDGDNTLLNAALTAGFAAEGKRQLRSEMAMVSNQVLVARSVDFGDLDAVREAVATTHNYLNLGLEHLAGGDLPTAIEQLRDTHLKLLFRLGVSLTIDLRKSAQQTVTRLGLRPEATRQIFHLDTPYREAIGGFLARMPRFYTALEGKGGVEMRDFHTMRDLHLGYAILDQIDALPLLFRSLLNVDIASPLFRSEVAAREVRLSQVLLTALARYALDGDLSPDPIESSRLSSLRSAIIVRNGKPGRLTDTFRASVERLMRERLHEEVHLATSDFVNSCLNVLEEDFAELTKDIDPRFLRSILIRRS